MSNAAQLEKHESLTVEPTTVMAKKHLPSSPFPRKYVHSVFTTMHDAQQAAQTLQNAHFAESDVYLLDGQDFIEAVSRGQSLFGFLTSTVSDVYLNEASQGRTFLAIRLSSYAQLKHIRDLLAPHHAYLVRYIDTWATTELLP